ncbi:phage portal protein [Natrinema sp. DC36]|uniref:anti-CBASS protein Acb1 family protein n=1 Tax=Natrinema sp. DC36 TaxID=2878680 RepID=UPI001CF09A1A|nr:anti-CBASS Acb1 family protein [Natrinema sp. DC36]
MSDPHINDVRWLYRTSFAKTLVDKPIKDSFKNGFEVKRTASDNTSKRLNDVEEIYEDTEFVPKYKQAQMKARRDGFSLLFMVLEDDSDGVYEDPLDEDVSVKNIKKLQCLTLDDMSKYHGGTSPPTGELASQIPYDSDDYEIRETGMVVDMDPTSGTYKEPLGYIVGQDNARGAEDVNFIHANRCFHYTWNTEVDSDLDQDTLGNFEGDSVLVTVYHILKGIKKGNWSIMQTLFRYAAKLYHVALPEDADEEDRENAEEQLQNLNAKGELLTPHGYEIDDFQTDGQLQPREYFDVLFDQVCASMEMTKSVLFGTQSGVVSGSETDIKNYFNQVQRIRQSIMDEDLKEFIQRYYRMIDGRTDSYGYKAEFEIDWGPLFKLSDLDQAETLSRTMQTLKAAIDGFIMTPMEARSILKEEWAEADIDWNDEFSTEEEDFLKTLNIAQMGTEGALPGGSEINGSTQQQNGGGMEQGQTTASEDPSTDSEMNDDILDAIAERVVAKMD